MLRISRFLALILAVVICIGGFIGCDILKRNPVEAKYDTLPYGDYVVRADSWYDKVEDKSYSVTLKFGDGDLILLTSLDELTAANIHDLERSEDFFEENALLVMQYTHSSSDEMIEFVDIAIKEGKLYPVVSTSFAANQPLCDNIKDTLIIADVKKSDVEKYSFGKLLAINLEEETLGSKHHEKFE